MSLVRNFTKRARAHTRGNDETPRSCNVRYVPGTINRAKISLPTELISTTNVHALNAPDIRKTSADLDSSNSSADSINSDNDFSSIDKGFLTADNSSTSDLSPITPITPFSEMMQDPSTKDFFSSKPVVAPTSTLPTEPVPAIPTRAPSHSKKAHVELNRQRSFQRSMSPPPIDIVKPTQTTTRDMFSSKASESSAHPFSRELAKVEEVAERFGGTSIVLDEEENEMMAKGLHKFSVDDYLAEITGMTGGIYDDRLNINPWSY